VLLCVVTLKQILFIVLILLYQSLGPYVQCDIMYFGDDAGKQCVAVSLSALIYNKIKGIHSCNDLVQIMEMVINYCIQHCHNVQGRCIQYKQNYRQLEIAMSEKNNLPS